MADELTRQLRMSGYPALGIHGDKGQAERDWVIKEFKEGKSPICVGLLHVAGLVLLRFGPSYFPLLITLFLIWVAATDVAARGLGLFVRALLPASKLAATAWDSTCLGTEGSGHES